MFVCDIFHIKYLSILSSNNFLKRNQTKFNLFNKFSNSRFPHIGEFSIILVQTKFMLRTYFGITWIAVTKWNWEKNWMLKKNFFIKPFLFLHLRITLKITFNNNNLLGGNRANLTEWKSFNKELIKKKIFFFLN